MKKTIYAVLIVLLVLLLGAGDNHEHLTTAVCAGCLHAPVLIEQAKVDVITILADFGEPEPVRELRPVARFVDSSTQLRAPPRI